MTQYSRARQFSANGGSTRRPERSMQAATTQSDGPTYDELYEEARKRGLKGRSKMSKTELERALAI